MPLRLLAIVGVSAALGVVAGDQLDKHLFASMTTNGTVRSAAKTGATAASAVAFAYFLNRAVG